MTIEDKIAKVSKNLLFSEPFYGLFLTTLNKKYCNVPTAGVSKNGINYELSINKDYANSLTLNKLQGLLKHELLHIAFGHIEIKDEFLDFKLFNISADLEINQYIDPEYLPDGGLTLDTFAELNLPEKAGTKIYYKLLEKAKNSGKSSTLDNILNQMDGDSIYDHSTWKEFNKLTDTEKKLIEKQKKFIFKEIKNSIEKSKGILPGELNNLLLNLDDIEKEKFDWKNYFRRFIGNSMISYTKKLKRKYNKRYIENPGLKIKFKNKILVGVDTSGSVSDDELKEFMHELYHIHKTGHDITVIQCDTHINSVEKFNPKKEWNIKKRGGTEFQPVIDYFNEKKIYTALVYLTDGECENPINTPKNTLWVLSSASNNNKNLPGKTIKLNG